MERPVESWYLMFARMISDNLYALRIHVAIGPLDEFRAYFAKQTGFRRKADTTRWGQSLGKVVEHQFDNGGVEYYVWFPYVVGPETVAHESFHLTAQIMRARSIYLSNDSEEAYAYYLGRTFIELAGVLDAYEKKRSADRGGRKRKKKAARIRVRHVRG